jgi:hypothetical protein
LAGFGDLGQVAFLALKKSDLTTMGYSDKLKYF